MLDKKSLRSIFQIDSERASQKWGELTRREREVAEKMARGLANKEIAEKLKISPKTLDIHRSKVKLKLGAKTAAGVAVIYFAIQLSQHLAPTG